MSPGARRGLATVLLCTGQPFLAGCHGWRAKQPPGSYVAERRPERVRLTLRDESRVELTSPAVAGDSLAGLWPGGPELDEEARQVAQQKDRAIQAGDYETAARLRHRERELGAARGSGTRTSVALADVQELEVRQFDPLKTTGLVFGVAGLTFLGLGALVAITWD